MKIDEAISQAETLLFDLQELKQKKGNVNITFDLRGDEPCDCTFDGSFELDIFEDDENDNVIAINYY